MDALDVQSLRRRIHEAVSEIVQDEELENIVLSGWVFIYEGVHSDGRSLGLVTSDASGDEKISPWVGEGFLHHVANNYEYYEGYLDEEIDGEEDLEM